MPQFVFSTISRTDIEGSLGGSQMLRAIDYDGPDNLLITGCPGSGKTTVSIMRAERLKLLDKNILLFTFQDLLKNSLRNIATNNLKKDISGFYKWYSSKFQFLKDEDTESEIIEAMKEWDGVDEIIIDEGQDFEDRIYKSIITKAKRMTVGADNAQKIHDKGLKSNEIKFELSKYSNVSQINLQYNYRNTFEIYNFARHFLPFNERANNQLAIDKIPKGKGELPILFLVPNLDSQIAQLKILLDNAGDRNIAVLFYFQREVEEYYKIIQDMGFNCSMHDSNKHIGDYIENILVTTYKSAKGLEFQVVIMPNMDSMKHRYFMTDEHYYISCTRARESLFLIINGVKLPNHFFHFNEDCYKLNITEKFERPNFSKNELDIDTTDLPF